MAFTKADKEYLDLKFKPIEDHLAKINGRVSKHGEQIDEALLERGGNRIEQKHHFDKLDMVAEKVGSLEDDLLEYKMVKKYPRFSLAAMFIFGGVLVLLSLAQLGII